MSEELICLERSWIKKLLYLLNNECTKQANEFINYLEAKLNE